MKVLFHKVSATPGFTVEEFRIIGFQ